MKAAHPTWIEIDTKQLRKNLTLIRKFIGKAKFCLPIKANAYGHGLVGVAKVAEDLVDSFGVSCLQEGVTLRQSGIKIPILVFGAFHEDQVEDLARFNLEFSISSKFKADLVAKKLQKKCRVHLEVETGMQRTGVRPATAIELIQHLQKLPCFEVAGVYSHLARADVPSDPTSIQQISEFQSLLKVPFFQGIPAHIANSGGVAHYKEAHLDMVRPGLMAFGYLPENAPQELQGIKPCFSLKSRVSYFKVVAKGQGISYGHTYMTKEQTRIATISIGYGDGYRRSLSNRGAVLIHGQRHPIVGTICMDQFMVDVGRSEAYVGDEVVLIGRQGSEEISLKEMAQMCDTIPYEVLCLFNERIPRLYV